MAKPPLELRELDNRRQNYFKKSLLDAGAGNNAENKKDLRKLASIMPKIEGDYVITKGTMTKGEYLGMIERMARSDDKTERIQAAIALGNIRIDSPEFGDRKNFPIQSAWLDELLMILGTDKEEKVRKAAFVALNQAVSATQLNMEAVKKMKK